MLERERLTCSEKKKKSMFLKIKDPLKPANNVSSMKLQPEAGPVMSLEEGSNFVSSEKSNNK